MAHPGLPWHRHPGIVLQLPDIDRGSPVPPYRQVAAHLAAAIRAGLYAPGDRLPSIVDLVGHYGIARYTAGKALRLLGEQGWAELSGGMGWYVTGRPPNILGNAKPTYRHRVK